MYLSGRDGARQIESDALPWGMRVSGEKWLCPSSADWKNRFMEEDEEVERGCMMSEAVMNGSIEGVAHNVT